MDHSDLLLLLLMVHSNTHKEHAGLSTTCAGTVFLIAKHEFEGKV